MGGLATGRTPRTATIALAGLLAACNGAPPPDPVDPADTTAIRIPARGGAATLDVGTWNVEWFGDPGNGPGDEARQLRYVRDVINGAELDLWGVQEVVSTSHFEGLLDQAPDYDGFLADDPSVTGGAAYYSDFGGNEQKVGLLYRSALVTVRGARVILTDFDYQFAGRPPLEVEVTVGLDPPVELVVIVLHAKAGADQDDWTRRHAAATALKEYLDATYPMERVLVLGDFNDDVDVSIVQGLASPYQAFVDDAAAYRFPTATLSSAGATSTVFYTDMVDHHLVTDEVAAAYIDGSAEAYRVDEYIPDYGETASDHFPVLTRYDPAGG